MNGLFHGLLADAVEGLQPRYADLAPLRDDAGSEPGVVLVTPPGQPAAAGLAGAAGEPGDSDAPGERGAAHPSDDVEPDRPSPPYSAEPDQPAGPTVPSPAGRARSTTCAAARRCLIADLLSGIERTGWQVHEPDQSWRPARPGDVAVLLPTFTRVGFYEQALRQAGLPYRVDGGRTFFERREIVDTLAVLRAVDTAADPVAVYAALHGGLFALSDDRLYAYRAAGGEFDYLRAAAVDGFPDIAAALADLRELHELRNRRPVAETLDDLVRRSHLLESLALWADDGEQAIANIGELVSRADGSREKRRGRLHAFVADALRDADAADTAESPVGEPASSCAAMTVHKAKGLEFPIVVLAAAMFTPPSPERDPLIDRAARRLDCSLSCPSPDPGGVAGRVRYQTLGYEQRFARESRRSKPSACACSTSPSPGRRSARAAARHHGAACRVAAGALAGGRRGGRRPPAARMDGGGGAAGGGPAAPPADPLARAPRGARSAPRSSRAPRAAPCSRRARSSASNRPTGTTLRAGRKPSPAPARPASGATSDRGARARALALGTAVHAVLEAVSLHDDAGLDDLAVRPRWGGAGLPDGSRARRRPGARLLAAAPLRAAAGARHERELPVCVVHDGVTIEGAIDLVYRAASGAWTIVDYKTDAHPDPRGVFERYGGQAGAYALAFEAAGGGRVAAVEVLLAALPDLSGAATVVHLPVDDALRDLVAQRLREAAAPPVSGLTDG